MAPLFVQTPCVRARGIGREQESRAPEPSPTFGQAFAGIGDVTGDSVPDFVVSDPGRVSSWDSRFQALGDGGRVWLLPGKDGSTFRTIASEDTDDGFATVFCGRTASSYSIYTPRDHSTEPSPL